MSSEFYLKQEAKKHFRDWTIGGLKFLLQKGELQTDVEIECKKAITRLHSQQESIS